MLNVKYNMQQESKFNSFDKDLGLDLLMNPRKKSGSNHGSDIGSIRGDEDRFSIHSGSIKSVNIRPNVIDVGSHINNHINSSRRSEYTEEDDDDVDYETEESFDPVEQTRNAGWKETRHSSASEGSQIESLGLDSIVQEKRGPRLTEDEIIIMKKELLYQFERLEKKGMKLPRKFTLASNLEEMKMEYDRLKRDKEVDSSVKLQRRIMMAVVSGAEFLNDKFDPVGAKLEGWSDSIYENIDDYDDIFEELHEKYKGKAKMAPELKLLMMLGGSAFMHHMTHSMFKSQLPGLDEILKKNPDLAKNLAAATSEHITTQQSSAGNLFGSLGNMFSGIFNGGGGAPVQPMPQQSRPFVQQTPKSTMKGPSNVDELLKEFEATNNTDNDRIEMMSAITESELAELADDSSSINGLLMGAKKKKKSNKISLDI